MVLYIIESAWKSMFPLCHGSLMDNGHPLLDNGHLLGTESQELGVA